MKIIALRFFALQGTAKFNRPSHGEPIGKPCDIYPHMRADRLRSPRNVGEWSIRVRQIHLRIETDEGTFGQFGPVAPDVASLVQSLLAPRLVGLDALATEMLWDIMYLSQAHGRGGLVMHAISAVDCALWDLRGRAADMPVYRLLGGPTREHVEAYAQTKGMSFHPDHLLEQAQELVNAGWRRIKVFLNHGPGDGIAGMDENERVIRTLREGLSDGVQIMADAWRSWDWHYAVQMLRRLAGYNLAWIEEPLRPEFASRLSELRRMFGVPIACGEHEYTRWGAKTLLEAGAADVLQPDVTWSGGLTEMRRIIAVASAFGVPVVPHTNVLQPNAHLLAAVPPGEAPMLECPVFADKFSAAFFLKTPAGVVPGKVSPPATPGLGSDWDEARLESVQEIDVDRRPA